VLGLILAAAFHALVHAHHHQDMGEALDRIRALCLALPETSERASHGSPTFFIAGKHSFVTFQDDHHGDGRLAIWAAAPPEMQRVLVDGAPEHYFVPPYVGHRGWIGVRLDRGLDWDEIAGVVEDAWLTRAPKRLVDALG
jgi:hypothetical protein